MLTSTSSILNTLKKPLEQTICAFKFSMDISLILATNYGLQQSSIVVFSSHIRNTTFAYYICLLYLQYLHNTLTIKLLYYFLRSKLVATL